MSDAVSIGLSGLHAATMRIEAGAGNVANAGSDGPLAPKPGDQPPYQPIDVVQVSVPGGGTSASFVPVTPATTQSFDPLSAHADANGLVAAPNVDVSDEIVKMIAARQAYKANLKSIEVANSMQDEAINLIA